MEIWCARGSVRERISRWHVRTYAAPPVLMVTSAWGWDTVFMASTFGWKAALAVLLNATVIVALVAREAQASSGDGAGAPPRNVPFGVTLVHIGFLIAIVLNAHHAVALSAPLYSFWDSLKLTNATNHRCCFAKACLSLFLVAWSYWAAFNNGGSSHSFGRWTHIRYTSAQRD